MQSNSQNWLCYTTTACSLNCSMIETVQASTCSNWENPVTCSTTATEICTYKGESLTRSSRASLTLSRRHLSWRNYSPFLFRCLPRHWRHYRGLTISADLSLGLVPMLPTGPKVPFQPSPGCQSLLQQCCRTPVSSSIHGLFYKQILFFKFSFLKHNISILRCWDD